MTICDLFGNESVIHLAGNRRYQDFLEKVEELLELKLTQVKSRLRTLN